MNSTLRTTLLALTAVASGCFVSGGSILGTQDAGPDGEFEAGPPCDGGVTCGPACVDLQADPRHCGACGRACETPLNSTPTCVQGRCGFACTAGASDCDGDPANGCEAVPDNDVRNCGRCGTQCPGAPNAVPACQSGRCALACSAGFGDCNGDPRDGCETDLRANPAHCGACGATCAGGSNAAAVCEAGACRVTCRAGFADCDGQAGNGCETDVTRSTTHCGACGMTCPAAPNARPTCTGGVCRIACNTGFADCNANAADGCEMLGTCP